MCLHRCARTSQRYRDISTDLSRLVETLASRRNEKKRFHFLIFRGSVRSTITRKKTKTHGDGKRKRMVMTGASRRGKIIMFLMR